MNIAGMHGVSARNLGVNTVTNVTGVNAGILLFPQSVNAVDLEAAFDGDYSSFIKDHCVGYINCMTTVTHYDEYSEIKYNAVDYECSGVGFILNGYDFIAEDEDKSMVTVTNTEFYYPKICKYEDMGYNTSSTANPYTEAQINALTFSYDDTFDLSMSASINRLMSPVTTSLTAFMLLMGQYDSSSSNRVYKDLVYYRFDEDITVDTLIFKLNNLGSTSAIYNIAIQLFAKVDGTWVEVFRGAYEAPSYNMAMMRRFSEVTAKEWRIGAYGSMSSSPMYMSKLNLDTFMLGNSKAVTPSESINVDKAVIIPAAVPDKFSDPRVEPAGPIPSIFASAGPTGEVGLFSQTLNKGERIPFIESIVRLGV